MRFPEYVDVMTMTLKHTTAATTRVEVPLGSPSPATNIHNQQNLKKHWTKNFFLLWLYVEYLKGNQGHKVMLLEAF